MKSLLPFIRLFRRQWLMMLVGVVLTITTLMAGIGLLSLSGWFLSATAVAGLTVATAQAFNFFTPAGGVRFLSIMRTASRYGERLSTHEATFRLLTDLRIWVWRKLMPLSEKNLAGVRRGDLLNRLVADIDTLDHIYLRLLTPLGGSLLMIGLLYLFLSMFDTSLAAALCGALLLAWLALPLVFYMLGKTPGRKLVASKRSYRVELLEFLQGQGELTLFGARDAYRTRLDSAEQALLEAQKSMAGVTSLSQSALVLASGGVVLLMLALAANGVGDNIPPGPLFATMVFAAMACVELLMPLAGSFQHLSACIMAAERVTEITSQKPDIQFPEVSGASLVSGALQISDLDFSYHSDGSQPVLNGFNLTVRAGRKVALLGQTGCGKSTLLSLITRQWQPDTGSILLDGHQITDFTQAELRRGISVVSQRVYLFAGTLRDNLAIALMPDENGKAPRVDDEQLLQVLNRVGLQTLTQGDKPLNTWLGEGGRQLSGGELRRIGIARVLLRDAPLLLLDEPTEGLDKRTEREILALLFEFARDKTVLMISHRLTAMAQMDEIHLLEQGRITDSGTHESLLTNNSYYQSLYQRL
ncbi:cysteine/glutathione ABC transporter ATP-binding protein/permease CydC [Shewanella submarina]|uniref:Cysteine/glutathione ABC transporter ATP-binding protein/permease CydC n=1 Tax=Shewanella submarina TaxID=2016376 RepID=A0ABV7GAA4_9GAMM|nr:cysteine/glutathione ABC transporter ATP-binding protein/permease CydC [Shewanella submarina]MCL1037431.1 cysteine/glutathione ABC transporter ATP-binding protein/permease CydC [Shewanella submarina]